MGELERSLEAFIQKVLQIQKAKDERHLSKEDMESIAHNLGISRTELRMAEESSLIRGERYLRYQNYEDAIREFEQVLALNPTNAFALYGMASAYRSRWDKNTKAADRTQALHYARLGLEADPSYDPAYRLISDLKDERKRNQAPETPGIRREQFHKRSLLSNFVSVLIILVISIFMGGSYHFFQTLASRPGLEASVAQSSEQITALYSAHGSRGAICWVSSFKREMVNGRLVRSDRASIINPYNGQILGKVLLTDQQDFTYALWDNVKVIGDRIYAYDNTLLDFEARDIYTGQLVENREILSNRFSELRSGIGAVEESGNWFKITTREGKKFLYNPENSSLITEEQKILSQEDLLHKQDWIDTYQWYQNQHEHRKQFYLFKKKSSPYQHSSEFYIPTLYRDNLDFGLNNLYWYGDKVGSSGDQIFLNGIMLYGDQELCLIQHDSEIGPDAYPILSCVSAHGKVLWEKKVSDTFPLGAQLSELGLNPEITRSSGYIMLSNHWRKINDQDFLFGCAIDLKTGDVRWEYSPQLFRQEM
ncbi:MAG: hypothetical protein HC880_13995 [Bacteroidia bacterium]|nr:hypothetical protein [Bacteroidia bacterium]